MDARLRKRRSILRVSASRHIDCSVRRRPSRAGAFLRRAGKLVSSSPPLCRCARPRAGCAAPRSRTSSSCTPCGHGSPRPPCLARDRRAPSSSTAPCPRQPCPALANRALSAPYPSTSGGKSLILKRVAENRAPCSQFRFKSVSKTATHSEMFEKPPLI